MPIIACPHCGTRLEAPQSVLGREVVCGRCKRNFMAAAAPAATIAVPAPDQASVADASFPASPQEGSLGAVAAASGTGQPAACREAVPSPQPDANPYAQRSDAGAVGAAGGEPPPTPPPPPPGPFGAPPGYGAYRPAALPSGQANGALILGIISVSSVLLSCCCGLFVVAPIVCGIIAIIMANRANEAIALGLADPGGTGKAKAGRIMGVVGLVLGILGIAMFIILIAAGQLDKSGTFKFH